MSSKVSYLSSRSRAVYEVSLIEQFGESQERIARQQAALVACMWLGFSALASLALLLPALLS